jgi:hypothetical protein
LLLLLPINVFVAPIEGSSESTLAKSELPNFASSSEEILTIGAG